MNRWVIQGLSISIPPGDEALWSFMLLEFPTFWIRRVIIAGSGYQNWYHKPEVLSVFTILELSIITWPMYDIVISVDQL